MTIVRRHPYRFGFSVALLAMLAGSTPGRAEADPIFVDTAAESGLDFVHFNGMSGERYFPEMTGQGVALLDYDNDGDLDVYLVQGSILGPGKTLEDMVVAPRDPNPRDRLFRNDLGSTPDGGLAARFVDVTDEAGLEARGYGMGVATGDFDGDGFVDLYVTNYGSNELWRNRGDGTFEDVTERAGVDDPRWSTSASFLDFDGDGDLDLYVASYVDFSVEENPRCYAESSRRDYCGPSSFPALPDRLFENRGDGTFEDISLAAGIGRATGAGLGVSTADFDGNGSVDIFVANDGMVNFLWLGQGDGTFVDEALLAGVAVNREGQPEASMGIAAGDFDGDGRRDLFATHLAGETDTLYLNQGYGLFEDRTIETGLAAQTISPTSFGTGWLDFDLDGWLDLIVVSGAVRIDEEQAAAGDPFPLAQPNHLLRSVAGQRLESVSDAGGPAFTEERVSRGLAIGDLDGDGAPDAVVANNNGPVELLLNRAAGQAGWLGLSVATGSTTAPASGIEARVETSAGKPLVRWSIGDGSYCSANDARILFGLGERKARAVSVRWPGEDQVLRIVGSLGERYLVLRQDGP